MFITAKHVQAQEVLNHKLQQFLKSFVEEMPADFPEIPREHLLIMLGKTFLWRGYLSLAAAISSAPIAAEICKLLIQDEADRIATRHPKWNRPQQNSVEYAALMELILKAYNLQEKSGS